MFGNVKDLRKEYDRLADVITTGEFPPADRAKLMNQKKEAFAKWYEASAPERQAEKAATPNPRKAAPPPVLADPAHAGRRATVPAGNLLANKPV